ncbi:MAG: hypothetical protein HC831_12190 [Chloroflexia bacterium]|nr:hypothetical protein [Chloroflexia bacterium]
MGKMTREEAIKYAIDNYSFPNLYTIGKFNVKEEEERIEFFKYLKTIVVDKEFKVAKDSLELFNVETSLFKERIRKEKEEARIREKELRITGEESNAKKFRHSVKPGMIIKVKGTNDGKGYRLVLETSDFSVTCRKLSYRNEKWRKEKYITEHYWPKVTKILVENPSEIQFA